MPAAAPRPAGAPAGADQGAGRPGWDVRRAARNNGIRLVGDATIQEGVRKVILTYWNTVAFHTLYAGLARWTPDPQAEGPHPDGSVLDHADLARGAAHVERDQPLHPRGASEISPRLPAPRPAGRNRRGRILTGGVT